MAGAVDRLNAKSHLRLVIQKDNLTVLDYQKFRLVHVPRPLALVMSFRRLQSIAVISVNLSDRFAEMRRRCCRGGADLAVSSLSSKGEAKETIEEWITFVLRIDDGETVRDAECAELGIALMATSAEDCAERFLPFSLHAHIDPPLCALYSCSRELAPKVRAD